MRKSLIFQEMELLGSNIKKFQEMETPKKNPYISGIGNPKKASYFWEMEQSTPKNFLYFLKRKLLLYFWKRKPPKNFCLRKQKT